MSSNLDLLGTCPRVNTVWSRCHNNSGLVSTKLARCKEVFQSNTESGHQTCPRQPPQSHGLVENL